MSYPENLETMIARSTPVEVLDALAFSCACRASLAGHKGDMGLATRYLAIREAVKRTAAEAAVQLNIKRRRYG